MVGEKVRDLTHCRQGAKTGNSAQILQAIFHRRKSRGLARSAQSVDKGIRNQTAEYAKYADEQMDARPILRISRVTGEKTLARIVQCFGDHDPREGVGCAVFCEP
jgi:hypothetical protein